MTRTIGVSLIALLLLVSACTRFGAESVSCEVLTASDLRAFIRTEPTPEAMRDWIETHHPGIEIDSYTLASPREATIVAWDEGQRRLQATFDKEEIQFLTMSLSKTNVTLAQVEECLGAPELFRTQTFSAYRGQEILLEVWYPQEGITASFGRQNVRTERERLSRDFQAQNITYLNSENLESGVATLHLLFSDETAAQYLESLTTWREDIESVEVEWE